MKQEFQYKLANVDMHKVYSSVISEFKKIPEIMVYEELEDGNNILRYRIRSGKDIIFLKKADDMIHVLRNELKGNKAPSYFDLDWSWHHELEDEEVAMWCKVVLLLSEALNVNCPQVHFSSWLGGDAVALEAAMKRKDEIDVSLKDETKLYLKALGELENQE